MRSGAAGADGRGDPQAVPSHAAQILMASTQPKAREPRSWGMDCAEQRSPIAFFLTFRTYGTWLHGDSRESVDRFNNAYGTPRVPLNPPRLVFEERALSSAPVYLGPARRAAVRQAILATCELREWFVHALNVRTNHVHIVATLTIHPRRAVAALKANATRVMRARGCWGEPRGPWARGGSARWIWTPRQLDRAIEYVMTGQGPDLD